VSPCLRLAPQGVVQAALTLCQSDQPLVPHLSPLSRLSSFLSSLPMPPLNTSQAAGQPNASQVDPSPLQTRQARAAATLRKQSREDPEPADQPQAKLQKSPASTTTTSSKPLA